MQSVLRFRRAAFAILIGALLACGQADPLEAVRTLQSQGRFSDSLVPLRALLASRPDDPEVHFRYGIALVRSGEPGMALWSLREASEHPDWAVPAGLELAAVTLKTQNWATAIEAAGRVLAVDPENRPALALRAEARLNEKSDLEAALADYDRALELEPDNFGLQAGRAAALLSLGRVDEAAAVIAELEELAREASVDEATLGHFCVTRATFASERRVLEEAEALFTDCLVRFPTHRTVLELAIGFFDERGSPERATEILAAALERVPQALVYRDQLARRLRAANDFEQSEQVLRAGLELGGPGLVAGVWTALADHFVDLGDLVAAAEAYEQSLGLSPEPTTRQILALADVLARAEQNERALEVAQRLANPIHRGLVEARVHLNRHQPARALQRLDEILPSWPNNPGARYYAARAAEQLGDFDRAIEEYRQSIRSRPEFTDAGLRLARLHEAEGAGERAWSAATHHYRSHPGGAGLGAGRRASRGPAGRARQLGGRAGVAARRPQARPHPPSRCGGTALPVRASARAGETRPGQRGGGGGPGGPPRAGGLPRDPRPRPGGPAGLRAGGARRLSARNRARSRARRGARRARTPGRRGGRCRGGAGLLRPRGCRPAERLRRHADSGRSREAEERWEALLREHPWSADAALQLAALRLARGADARRTLELAQRARRFGGGQEAEKLLARVRREMDEAGPVD
jgi:tetratricopeptide (TPR) repeat protein